MRLKTCLLRLMACGVIAVLFVGCAETAPPAEGLPSRESAAPAPTPVPPSAIASANEFAGAQADIQAGWDAYHQQCDSWRAGLTSCSRNAAETSLRGLASDAAGISSLALDLPRSADTRALADLLVEASEGEETAFRRLSIQWQPGTVSLFEAVDEARFASNAAQTSVADGLYDLTFIDPDIQDTLDEFSSEFEKVADEWADLENDYGEVRDGQDTMSAEESIDGLNGVVTGLEGVRGDIEDLPSSAVTDRLVKDMLDAVDDQIDALQSLIDDFEGGDSEGEETSSSQSADKSGQPLTRPSLFISPPTTPGTRGDSPLPSSQGQDPGPQIQADPPDDPPEGTPEGEEPPPPATPTPTPDGGNGASAADVSFDDADDAFADAEGVRSDVRIRIKEIMDNPDEGLDIDLESVKDFEAAYGGLVSAWDRFHASYTGWRATDGGCDREQVAEALAGFSETLGGIAFAVRALPRDSFLRPMGNALNDAVQQEQEALRVLGYDWRPFSTDAFRAFDESRSRSLELRRETEVRVDELLTRFGSG